MILYALIASALVLFVPAGPSERRARRFRRNVLYGLPLAAVLFVIIAYSIMIVDAGTTQVAHLGQGTGAALRSGNADSDKGQAVVLARKLSRLGFEIMATLGTAERLREVGLKVENVFKVNEGRPNIVDHIKRGEIALVINTPLGRSSHFDEQAIRRAALQYNVPCVTTMTGAQAIVEAIAARETGGAFKVRSLQEMHAVGAAAT